ncbi:MAG: BrnA antitoxin family protein [Stappiaceae bacterium]|uniref:BrnA antitoxin family protein n=1 Tax=Roseibium sp. TaxID=1936156 RepID=UPI003298900E
MGTTKFTIDPSNPKTTPKEVLARFDAIKDKDIDYSDIPEIDDVDYETSSKVTITARIDSDVVAWFKSQGPGYQTKTNAVLRAFYERHR